MIRWTIIAFLSFGMGTALAQPAQPRSFADWFDVEMARAVKQTNRDLRESQHRAGLVRMRCERAVERKQIQDRAKTKR